MQVAGFDSLGLGSSRFSEAGDRVRNVSSNDKWVNFETDFDEDEMMQNDEAGAGSSEPMDDFQKLMKQLEQMKTKPLFTQEEEEEVTEDDDLFDDDEDYEDAHSVIQKQKQKDQESKKPVFDDEDDDYYDDYSDEEYDGKKSDPKGKSSTGSSTDSMNVMQDFMKGKTATHRFKSRFDDFADDGDELLSSGSRKLRKNDSIKVISTPNGKVGILYKVEPKSPEDDKTKKSNESQNGAPEVHQKITPVITADGKVALLYRGASDNSETFRNKYEPITNKDILTQLIDNNNKSTTSSSSSNTLNSIKNITTKNSIYNSNYDSYDSFNRNSNNVIIDPAAVESDSIDSSVNNRHLTNEAQPETASNEPTPSLGTELQSTFTTTATMTTTTMASLPRREDALNPLPDENDHLSQERQENTLLINRPLSEVLGIKKNLYLDTSVKIPNIETSTHKMRITNSNNLLSSLLSSINGSDNSAGPNNRIVSNYVSKNFRNNANIEYDDRLSLSDRGGYSVNGFSRSRFSINRRTTPALPPRIIKEESDEEWSTSDDNSVEVVNFAIIPAFEHEIDEKYIRPYGDEHYHRRHRHHYNNVAPGHPTVHCAMQVIVACVALGTFFGIAGTFFRFRIIDQIRILYW